jgi:integrase
LWAIQAYTEPVRRKRQYFKKDTPLFKEIAAKVKPINDQFVLGKLDEPTVDDLLRTIINEYLSRGNTQGRTLKTSRLSKANETLLNSFWEKRYAHKILVDEKSAKSDFSRALRLAGDISLYTSEPKEFMGQLKKNCKNTDQYRRAVSSLNELLNFVGRDFRLTKPEEEYKEIRYLTESEVKTLADSAPTHLYKLITYVLFGTGARTGEIYAIDKNSLGDESVHITKQIPLRRRKADKVMGPKKPKRGKVGWVKVIKSTWKHVQEWALLDKSEVDRYAYYNWVTAASLKLWPDQRTKNIKPHDLRHSHAVHLLDKGISLTMVAKQLRNRVEICQKYYAGHEHTPDSLESLKGKI